MVQIGNKFIVMTSGWVVMTHDKKIEQSKLCSILVPKTGLEPVRCCHRGILSPVRLPISPLRRGTPQKLALGEN